ncbi:cell division control protein 48 homolog B-like [Prunus yedoensis var. nudiflora]|uniref:Cell division control protein 48 homolog B-like n=1 Tax=Prunus yedoensis var. nudiflora TaxID=2094558 RepID=A0A314YHI6_PRUYE|nr:cell division control protein 48 homolog B-like [Prunus yedoensis var. nudiflora]
MDGALQLQSPRHFTWRWSCSKVSPNTSNTKDKRQWRAKEAMAGNAKALRELIIYPLFHSREAQKIGLKWRRGLLLYGPPGTGKTKIVIEVAGECSAHLTIVSSVPKPYDLQMAFAKALSHALPRKPPPVA